MNMYDIADCIIQNAKLVPNLLGGAFIQFGAQEGGCVITFWESQVEICSDDLGIYIPYKDIKSAGFPLCNDALRIETNAGAIINVRIRS